MADLSLAVQKQIEEKAILLESQSQESIVEPFYVKEHAAPLDFSFLHLTTVEDAEKEDPRNPGIGQGLSPRHRDGKFDGRCLRLNNNALSEVKTINNFTEKTFREPDNIGWIDLSFNGLTTIDESLLEYKNLQILYLHGNNITDIKEVEKLASLTNLKKLTLHGNGIEKEKGYRMYVLSSMPWLRNFDFSAVTKCEARMSHIWKLRNNAAKKKKKTVSDDD